MADQRGGPLMLVAHPTGNANSRSAALALDEAGLLAEFWTCVNWRDDSSVTRVLPERIRRQLRRRSFSEIPASKIHSAPLRELGRNLADAVGWGWPTRHESGPCSIDAVYHSFDRRIARRLHEAQGLRGVYVPEDGGLASLQAAREVGIAGIYELPIGYWRAAQEIYREERERKPEWATTLTGVLDSHEKLARKDEELRLARRIIVPSTFVRRTLELAPSLGGPVDLAPYGGPPAIEQLPDRTSNGPLRILFVGQLSQRKGLSDLFEAVAPLGTAVVLTMIGRKTSQECRPLDAALSHHRWISSLPHDELLEEMGRHDVLVLPSLFEGFALVILEAMSRGLTVIATPNTGASDIITDGDNGFIVPIRDPAAIQERIERVLDDRERLESMQQEALSTARRHTWAQHRSRICEVVRDAISDEPSSDAGTAQP
jgi:starch synthase